MLLNRGCLRSSRLWWLCIVLLLLQLTQQSVQAELFEGDDCEIKGMPGKCALGSKCATFRDGLKQKKFSLTDKVHCGFSVYEEIICCPNSNAAVTAAPRVSERVTTEFWEDLLTTTLPSTTARPLVIANTVLDASLPFFDFSKHLSGTNTAPMGRTANEPIPMEQPNWQQMQGRPNERRNANSLRPESAPAWSNGQGPPVWPNLPHRNYMQFNRGNAQGPRRNHISHEFDPNRPSGDDKSPEDYDQFIKQVFQTAESSPVDERPNALHPPSDGGRPVPSDVDNPIQWANEKAINAGVNIVTANLVPGPPGWRGRLPAVPFTDDSFQRNPNKITPAGVVPAWRPFQRGPVDRDDGACIPTNNLVEDPSSTTVKTVSTRGNSERPAAMACREIDDGLEFALTQHILGGTVVELGEYPHMAAIGYRQIGDLTGPYEFRCGGSLIAKRFVLTAAHCVSARDSQAAIVRMGVTNFTDPDQMRNVVEISVQSIHIHPDYRSNLVYNDIAILELETEVTYSTAVYPTCLHTDPADLAANSVVYVTGWGTVNISTRQNSNVLLKARLDMINQVSCNASYVDSPSRRQPLGIIATQICAFAKSKDACQGDSGGPLNLVLDENTKKYRLVGIISAGISCGIELPGIYTRIAHFLNYIESVVWPKAATASTELAFS